MRLTGTPTRAEIGTVAREDAAQRLELDPARRTLLVLGGSQGAASINNAVMAALPWLLEQEVQVLWATGRGEFARVERALEERLPGGDPRLHPVAYMEQVADAYAVADLVVSRAGATTLAEIMRAGLPSLLVPYPHAAADHQTENARTLLEAGAAVVVADAELPARFGAELQGLLTDAARRRAMGERARALGHPAAAQVLAEAVLHLAEQER